MTDEELEAKLAKAVKALKEINQNAIQLRGEQAYREFAVFAGKKARTTLAELTGGKDA